MTTRKWLAGVVVLPLALSACATTDDSSATEAGAPAQLTVSLPFASCLAWWPLHAAESEGYLDEEDLDVTFEGLDGSAAAIQAVLAGKAEVALSAPDNYLSAVAEGADLTALYSVYQSQTFNLVTPEDSDISSLEDLKGETIGISTPGGGDVTYAQSLLKLGADLDLDDDYQQLAVGDGGSATTALKGGEIKAYSASYFDAEIIKSSGVPLRTLSSDDYPDVVGIHFVADSEYADGSRDVLDRLGRAVAKGTEWGLENKDAVLDMCAEVSPQELEDPEFAATIVDRVSELVTLPDSANGKYGWIDEDAWNEYRDLLIELEVVPEDAKDADVDNKSVDAWNAE